MGPVFEKSSRVEPFSDGIFAIATTLLVLEFRVPELPAGSASADLARALLGLWPSMLAYLLAFLTLLVAWIGHHILLDRARRVDGRLLVANG
ncbi:MAG TPA: TMEM175 family protein, partial [Deinococcales bacterium]|nr:TMEM175 family protein [Deinococcales bacterium]